MKIGKRNVSTTAIIALLLLMLVSAVLGTVLYTLTKTGTWNVRTATGLELDYSNGTQVTTLSFTVDPLGSQTQNFVLKNLANHEVNVTSSIPDSTSLYTFTTTFANSTLSTPNTIPQGGTYAFSITLTDLGMDSTQTYNGNFAYNIVDAGPSAGNLSFGTTTVNYVSDSAQYFGFVSDNFNASSYPVGTTVLYSFTTKNINLTYEIQGLSYKLEIYDSSNNLVNTVCDGLVVAYYQNSTAYGQFGNGTHMTTQPLMPNGTMTIWNSFTAPNTPGTYHLRLTYQSHNASPLSITWTTQIINPFPQILVTQFTIAGATGPGIQGNVTMTFRSNVSPPANRSFDYNLTIVETGQLIDSQTGFGAYVGGNTRIVDFTTTGSGPLTMLLNITSATN